MTHPNAGSFERMASGTWFLPGVTVGKNCVVGAGSLVTRDVPDNSLVLGSPGRVVRKLEDNEDRWERQDLHV